MTTFNLQTDRTMCCDGVDTPSTCGLPHGLSRLECQVAGHPFNDSKNSIAMLRGPVGQVMKPIIKPNIGEREIAFYERLQASHDPTMLELKNYVPKYFGTTELEVFGKRVKFLILKDITEGMAEPCVMDVKIGRRTWDPLATPEKKAAEESKYAKSKQAYGFCIPGFQVYNIATGELKKFGKEYGKKLNAGTIVQALELFLNITPDRQPCRQLIVKLLSNLWKILIFFRTQRKLRFYSSSILITYDARRLRHYLRLDDQDVVRACRSKSFSSPKSSSASASTLIDTETRISSDPVSATVIRTNRKKAIEKLSTKRSSSLIASHATAEEMEDYSKEEASLRKSDVNKLCRTHSFVNNFDDEIARIKEDYDLLLNELSSSSEEKHNWLRVNMIDFTHVFLAEDYELDHNYLEGIENLIKIIETFLIKKNSNQ